jgi:hypothetical protein
MVCAGALLRLQADINESQKLREQVQNHLGVDRTQLAAMLGVDFWTLELLRGELKERLEALIPDWKFN